MLLKSLILMEKKKAAHTAFSIPCFTT